MAMIGIDLGTTNSLASYWKDGEVQLIGDETGQVLFPSVVGYIEGEGLTAGRPAKERMTEHSGETVCSFKRFMGTDKKYILGGSAYTPMELSAMVLERIRRNAEFALGEEIEEAIITVPAYFNDKQRSDTKKAAKIAGLRVERLVNEPSAAALAYRMEYGEEDRTLLVFDFGGGTLDLSYVECFDNIIEVPFENTTIPVLKDYDLICRLTYGEAYMTPVKEYKHDYLKKQIDQLREYFQKRGLNLPECFEMTFETDNKDETESDSQK